MSEQNFKNHTRLIPGFHFVTGATLLAILGGSIVNLVHADAHSHYSAALLVLVSLVLISLFGYSRGFALRHRTGLSGRKKISVILFLPENHWTAVCA
ncbi:MAG: DUF6526 family protein [Bacteroidota bacterium]